NPEQRDAHARRHVGRVLGEVEVVLEAGTVAYLVDLPVDRGGEAEVVEQRGPQLLDDATLERYAVVERLQHARELPRERRVAIAERLGHGRHVHLGADEDAAELVVNVARQPRLFLLPHRLQVRRQLGELAGALAHLALEPLALRRREAPAFILLANFAAREQPDDEQQRDRARRQPLHGEAREVDVLLPARVALGDARALVDAQRGDLVAEIVHHFLAHAGVEELECRVAAAFLVERERCIHLAEFLADERVDPGKLVALHLGSVPGQQRDEAPEALVELGSGFLVRLEVFRLVGQDVAALRRLGVGDEARDLRDQRLNLDDRRMRLDDLLQLTRADLREREDADRGDDPQREQERHAQRQARLAKAGARRAVGRGHVPTIVGRMYLREVRPGVSAPRRIVRRREPAALGLPVGDRGLVLPLRPALARGALPR